MTDWRVVNRQEVGTKLTVTAVSGARVTTKTFFNEFEADSFDWEADFKFALLKAQQGRLK